MGSFYWIKLYMDMLDDPRMGRLPDALFRRAIECHLLAGEVRQDGRLPPLADMAWRLRADERELERQLEALEAAGVLERAAEGGWLVSGFAVRQAPASGRERSQRLRDKRQGCGPEAQRDCNAGATNRYADTDTELEEESEEIEDTDADASTAGGGSGAEAELEQAFVRSTGLPRFFGGREAWQKALRRLRRAGVNAQDVEQAVAECRAKQLVIASLASVVNPAIISKASRARGRPEEDYRRYLRGEYGDFGSH